MDYSSTFKIPSKTYPGIVFEVHKPSHGRKVEFDREQAAYRHEVRQIGARHTTLTGELEAMREEFRRVQDQSYIDTTALLKTLPPDSDAAHKARQLLDSMDAAREHALVRQRINMLDPSSDHYSDDLGPLLTQLTALAARAKLFQEPPHLLQALRDNNQEAERVVDAKHKPALLRSYLVKVEGLTIDGKAPTVDLLIEAGMTDLLNEIVDRITEVNGLTPEQLKNSRLPSISSGLADGKNDLTTALNASLPSSTGGEIAAATSPN